MDICTNRDTFAFCLLFPWRESDSCSCRATLEPLPNWRAGFCQSARDRATARRTKAGQQRGMCFLLDGVFRFWRHIEHCLKDEREGPKNGRTTREHLPNCTQTPANHCLSMTNREGGFVGISLSDCACSTPEEMEQEHHYTDYQQNVDEAAGNVKGQESKQPKNNQNRRDYS